MVLRNNFLPSASEAPRLMAMPDTQPSLYAAAEQHKRLDALRLRWAPLIEQLHWGRDRVKFVLLNGPLPDQPQGTVAVCMPDWQYKRAEIVFSATEMAELSDRDLEYSVVHEIIHCYTHELTANSGKSDFHEHNERVTTDLTLMLVHLMALAGAEMAMRLAEQRQRHDRRCKTSCSCESQERPLLPMGVAR